MAHSKKLAAQPQHERFVEAARALGCNEDEEAFRDALRNVARQKPKAEPGSKLPARKGMSKK